MSKQKNSGAVLSALVIFFLSLSIVFADKVVTTVPQGGGVFELQFDYVTTIPLNTDYVFNFHVYNYTGVLITEGISCDFVLYGTDGGNLYRVHLTAPSVDNNYEISVSRTNFTVTGEYSYLMGCNNSWEGGFAANTFDVADPAAESNRDYYYLLIFWFLFVVGVVCLLYVNIKEFDVVNYGTGIMISIFSLTFFVIIAGMLAFGFAPFNVTAVTQINLNLIFLVLSLLMVIYAAWCGVSIYQQASDAALSQKTEED